MRFRQLTLTAFGPFSGFTLDLSSSAPGGLHVVFGPNEAGKSTALRAVRGLLFGITENTQDAHRFAGPELAIDAELETESGARLWLRRRKKRKDSLRDEGDAPLDPAVLTPFLHGVDASTFERLFGLDHAGLKQASERLLKGEGEVGETLFDAAAGGYGIGRVLRELEAESKALFAPQAKTRHLNVLLNQYKDQKKELREARLPPEAYHAQQESLDAARASVERLASEKLSFAAELTKLARIERAAYWVERRRVAGEQLSALGHFVPMPEGAPARRSKAEKERDDASQQVRHLEVELARRAERLQRLGPDSALAGLGDATRSELLEWLSAAREARRSLPEREAARAAQQAELGALARRLGLASDAESARAIVVRAVDIARARRLVAQSALLDVEAANLERRRAELVVRLEEATGRATSSTDDGFLELARAIDAARASADVEVRALELRRAIETRESAVSMLVCRLLPAPRGDVPLQELAVPSDASLERFGRELDKLEAHEERLQERQAELRERARTARKEIERIELTGEVPSEHDLERARALRDAKLTELAELASAGRSSPPGMIDVVREQVAGADTLADRLRREATRVAELATQRAELSAAQQETENVAAALGAARDQLEQARSAYAALWVRSGVAPLPPAEMRAWLNQQREASRQAEELVTLRRKLADTEADAERERSGLRRALGRSGAEKESLTTLLKAAEQSADSARAERRARDEALRSRAADGVKLAEVDSELVRHRGALSAWKAEFTAVLAALGLDSDLVASDVGALLEALSTLAEKLEALPALEAEVATLRARVERFESRVLALARAHAPDLATSPPEAAAVAFLEREREAVERARERLSIQSDVQELSQRLGDAQAAREDAERELRELVRLSGVGDPAELVQWEATATRAAALSVQLAEAERELAAAGEGRSAEDLAREVQTVARDEIVARKLQIQDELERIDDAFYDARRQVESLELGLSRLGGDAAADAAQRLAAVAADIRESSLVYARLHLARALLTREVARFQERHQGPVLQRASALFTRLTLGHYRGLRTGLDQRVIECVRDDGKALLVPELSEGTSYQLYLALRLASLERYLESNAPLPLVLDDAFIHFDDARARAGFEVLGELGRRVQVLFFTHHAHLGDLALGALPQGSASVHHLPSPER